MSCPPDLNLLFQRYARVVQALARRILGNDGEAEEVVQEVFLYAYRKANLFDPLKGSERTWVMQIAVSRSLDRKSYLVKRGFYAGTEIGLLSDTLLGSTDIEKETSAKFKRRRLESAFNSLSGLQRQTIERFYFEGLELREISEQLHEPLGNVRHHFYRGLKRLRESAEVSDLR